VNVRRPLTPPTRKKPGRTLSSHPASSLNPAPQRPAYLLIALNYPPESRARTSLCTTAPYAHSHPEPPPDPLALPTFSPAPHSAGSHPPPTSCCVSPCATGASTSPSRSSTAVSSSDVGSRSTSSCSFCFPLTTVPSQPHHATCSVLKECDTVERKSKENTSRFAVEASGSYSHIAPE